MDFDAAVLYVMRYEVGPWFKLDADTIAGLCSTKEQKRKTGYVNDPQDPGGETKFGVAKNANPKLNIKLLTWAEAKDLYKKKYWNPLSLDSIDPNLAVLLFDCAVNHGCSQATKFIQGAVGAKEDGQMGPVTLKLIGSASAKDLIARVLDRRRRFYKFLVMNKPLQVKFLKGWLARCDDLEKLLA